MRSKGRCYKAFTLIELLVVIAIISIIAAIIFPVFAQAKEAAKQTTCISNSNQIGIATQIYLSDFDNTYPQTRKQSSNPAAEDADGALEEPDYGSAFSRLTPYLKSNLILHCPTDQDPTGNMCEVPSPDHPDLNSYLFNAYFVFGLNDSQLSHPANTILFAERRSQSTSTQDSYCNYLYRPWFNITNSQSPENDMAPINGAIATQRHNHRSVFTFADSHTKSLNFDQTFSPSSNINLHIP
jgi:prepilin-type N-terminal cleavage/methylation domain-containing protein